MFLRMKKGKFFSVIFLYVFPFLACDKLPDDSIVKDLPDYYIDYLDGKTTEILQAKESMSDC